MHAPRTISPRERFVLQWQRAAPYAALLALNFGLFVPRFVCAVPQADFSPFFPDHYGHGHAFKLDLLSAYQYVLTLVLRRDNLDVFRWSIDFALMLVVIVASARSPVRVWIRNVCALGYMGLWLFLAYHHGVAHYFERTPALTEDARLALNLWHFLDGHARYAWLGVLLAGCALLLLGVFASRTFAALQLRAAGVGRSQKWLWCTVWVLPALVSVAYFGVERDDPLWQLLSKHVLHNYRAGRIEAQRMATMRNSPPDLRYEAFSQVRLERKPDVYLLMLEAYGEILATWDMRDAYQALMRESAARLERAGYRAASTYSAAPVHGGASWFSISTVNTGVHIDRPQIFAELEGVGARVPSLPRFFREQGYLTHALQPANGDRAGLRRFDLFHHAVPVDAVTLDYRGKQYGWGRIPDQLSLGLFREQYFRPSTQPRYAFYMCVSTHFPWDLVPRHVRDWHALAQPDFDPSTADDTWPLPEAYRDIATEYRRSYFRSISYEWQVLTEWLEAEAGKHGVILIVGDHQPRLEWNVPGAVTMNTPVHVLSQDPQLVEQFVAQGFQTGLYAEPGTGEKLQHAGLFSLLISQLAARYGAPGSAEHAAYFPSGLPLAALHR